MISMATAVTAGVVGVVLYWLFRPQPPPRHGVYPHPGRWYWLKRAIFAVMFWRRKANKGRQPARTMMAKGSDCSQRLRGLGLSLDAVDMESCQPLPDHPHATDCVYIGGYSQGGGINLSLRVARRGGREGEVWLVLTLPGGEGEGPTPLTLLHPLHPHTAVANGNPKAFSAGGLTFDLVHPMKTWRVSYSGQLRMGPCLKSDKPAKLLDVRFSFQWDAFAPHFNYDSDLDPGLLGDAVAREPWTREYFTKLQSTHQTHYEQWGELRGTLSVEGRDTQTLRLKAIRDHSFGVRKWTDFHRYVYCFLYIENGMTLQIGAVSQPGMLSHLKTGCLTYATGVTAAVTSVNFDLWKVGEEDGKPPATWSLSFVADGCDYSLSVTTKTRTELLHEGGRGVVHEAFCDVTLRCPHHVRQGWGLSEFFSSRDSSGGDLTLPQPLQLLSEPPADVVRVHQDRLVLPLTSPACASSALVGGKGSQLALLTQVSKQEDVSVPPGVCLTLHAFNQHMKEQPCLARAVQAVAHTAATDPRRLESVSRDASALLCRTAVSGGVRSAVTTALAEALGEGDLSSWRLAVRSSAAGEDGVEASSAGQMDTFLGVRGQEQVLQAVQKCWASAYSYLAVEYRRQHGQEIVTSMGVVLQQMVPAEAAGVLFTVDPVTNNNSLILINANLGLGESVVSGCCEPDCITVRRPWDSPLTISSKHIGGKKTKITMTDEGGIEEVEVSAADSCDTCLTDQLILRLASIGVKMEQYFGSARDIEWAYAEGTVYLLQARPITTSEQESEEELIHEFDSPLAVGTEWLTTGNISEMMPGAVTPLTISTFSRSIDKSMQCWGHGLGARSEVVDYRKALTSCSNNLFISLTEVNLLVVSLSLSSKEAMEMNILGETRPDLDLTSVLQYRGRPPPPLPVRLWNSLRMILYLRKGTAKTQEWERRLQTFRVDGGCHSATDLWSSIDQHMHLYDDVWHWTIVNSANSGSWSNILINIIAKGTTDWTVDHYGDIALLLSQCQGVYSAEVPAAMQDLAQQVVKEGLKETFLSSSDEDCVRLLHSDLHPDLQRRYHTFLTRHGHRCVRESEMREKSWQLEPTKLVNVLKTIVETGAHVSPQGNSKTARQLVSELCTPLNFITRTVLQYLLPKAWAAVALREWGKSVSVQMNEVFKTAYWKLASLMVKEGRLPDEDSLFFLTHYEIGVLLQTRSARLVIKAQRRRKVLDKQMALRFPKISIGHPQPVKVKTSADRGDASATMTGMPVSQGVVEGPARVVLTLQDAHLIQRGDVLVVRSTDVGWSPYFPLIAGLVTEIGGLISHGAVVAREYGIPCVVNIPNATDNIHNGTRVQLDGRAGTVKVLSTPSEGLEELPKVLSTPSEGLEGLPNQGPVNIL